MSTRAVFTFKGSASQGGGTFHVYKHCDGYPSGAAVALANAAPLAWNLPRFEADEFAAAFIAGNKTHPGNLRVTHGPQSHGDLGYRYVITCKGADLLVQAFTIQDTWEERIFAGPLTSFREFANKAQS
jgi:hypothetical protein